jgi:hypothetical protein
MITSTTYAMTPEQALTTIASAYTHGAVAQPVYAIAGTKATMRMTVDADGVRGTMTFIAQ